MSSVLLPAFTADGTLPPGDYDLTLDQLRASYLVTGPWPRRADTHWDAPWRERLVDNLGVLVGQLRQVGVREVFVNGSFVEDKDHPNDIDGYFQCDRHMFVSGELQQRLNMLDPHQVWTWDAATRRPYRGYPKKQLPMWHRYRVELYPHMGQPSGIRDKHGNELEFPAAFRQSRERGTPKGIIKIGAKP